MREEFYDGETFEFEHNGVAYVATIERDDCHGAPWEEEDGHGEVSEWTTRDKLPGEMVLNEDGRSKRFYDFAGACRTARRDGWGFLPYDLKIDRQGPQLPYKAGGGTVVAGPFTASDGTNFNRAISAVYKAHRETMTAREYAAGAAMADFERLRAWCRDDWFYIGVVVRRADACTCCGETESLWGIESDAGEYVRDVATELAEQLANRLSDAA